MSAVGSKAPREGGFTLVELILSVALLAILAAKVGGALTAADRASTEATRRVVLEDQAHRVLSQIGMAIMGASRETLVPDRESPLSNSELRFQVILGLENGQVVWGDPELVGLSASGRQVFWSQNPDARETARIVWSQIAAPYLEGELPNGMDDNGNGLIDEKGLSFEVDRDAVRIRLTLESLDSDGSAIVETVETTVTCRNLTAKP